MNVALRALMLALLARRRRAPVVCTLGPDMRDDVARRTVADYVGQAADFRDFVTDAAAGELKAHHRVPLAILTPALRATTGVESRTMFLEVGDRRRGARHIWMQHGPDSKRKSWERLDWPDWLLIQRIVDEVAPTQQPDGRWRFDSAALRTMRNRLVGFVLVAGRLGDALTPVTFYPVDIRKKIRA